MSKRLKDRLTRLENRAGVAVEMIEFVINRHFMPDIGPMPHRRDRQGRYHIMCPRVLSHHGTK
ncbi:MAG TPA: hypothetical protein PKJ16_11170 [Spirochaetota bacterium]|nr:hypothetical protein [Spirochaetota bacterium]HOS40391.1 hypothetical protein [Spirochaetota bacterium]HPU89055.1 hypothetical protein [Spirochaetota bacterium]